MACRASSTGSVALAVGRREQLTQRPVPTIVVSVHGLEATFAYELRPLNGINDLRRVTFT